MKNVNNNEITVKIKGDIQNVCENLKNKGFNIIDAFDLDDTYFIPKNLEIEKITVREILTKTILARDIRRNPDKVIQVLTFKEKNMDDEGNILSQNKSEVLVKDIEDAKNFLLAIGYKQILRIKEKNVTYANDEFEITLKDIEDGDKLIETDIIIDNEELNTVDKLIEKLKKYDIPIFTDNFFVKKAEIELEKVLRENI